jgi:REP element-mobilizing transposase RayT
MVVARRRPVFSNLAAARKAVRALHADAVRRHAETLAYVVMPDHVHWLVRLRPQGTLAEAARRYKALVSLALGERVWQRGFHDHALRDDEDLRIVARYIVANPLRAGLVDDIGAYPHWDAIWL